MLALSIAIVAGALTAGTPRADIAANRADLIESGMPDLPGWWSEYGRPGWVANAWMSPHGPWVMAGHGRGGWNLIEPGRPPRAIPDPGIGPADTPLSAYDSIVVRVGEGGAWSGFRGALATAYGLPTPRSDRGAETVVSLGSGDYGYDDNALMVDRVDSLAWARGEALGTNRLGFGSTDLAGRHRWSAAAGVSRGRHAVEGGLAQRGTAARLLSEDEESNSGAAGSVTYRYRAARWRAGVTGARGYDHHESFGTFLLTSRRDASGTMGLVEAAHDGGLEARLEARHARVSRTESEEFEAATSELWTALGYRRALGDGELAVALGGGRLGHTRDWEAAPSIHYRTAFIGGRAHIGIERVLNAVWSDLVIGEAPFVQRTWLGTAELEMGTRPHRARSTLLAGRTRDRALVSRVPLTDYGLRVGIAPDPDVYDFALAWTEAQTQWRRVRFGGEGFGMIRRAGDTQPGVDPNYGFRVWAESGFRAFQGDLAVVVRAGLDGVGERDSEFDRLRRLPGYATTSLQAQVSLASAIVTVRARNLENEVHEEPWFDGLTGLQALGPGREFRFALTLLLGN